MNMRDVAEIEISKAVNDNGLEVVSVDWATEKGHNEPYLIVKFVKRAPEAESAFDDYIETLDVDTLTFNDVAQARKPFMAGFEAASK